MSEGPRELDHLNDCLHTRMSEFFLEERLSDKVTKVTFSNNDEHINGFCVKDVSHKTVSSEDVKKDMSDQSRLIRELLHPILSCEPP